MLHRPEGNFRYLEGSGTYCRGALADEGYAVVHATLRDVTPTLTFAGFVDADTPIQHYLYAMSVSWGDAARALRAALEAPSLPSPYEYFHIVADLPHGVFPNDKAKRLLGRQPLDTLESHYTRPALI
jgi:hypothetical protein